MVGKRPHDVSTALQKHYDKDKHCEMETYLKMCPVDVLNELGQLGYRVTGYSVLQDDEHVWALERTLKRTDVETVVTTEAPNQTLNRTDVETVVTAEAPNQLSLNVFMMTLLMFANMHVFMMTLIMLLLYTIIIVGVSCTTIHQ